MKDMFDCLEESFIPSHDEVYIVRIIKNKRKQKQKMLYLYEFSQDGRADWTENMEDAILIWPVGLTYEAIRDGIRKYQIPCSIYRVPKIMKIKSIWPRQKKEKWWRRIKVWFSRKFEEFMTTPIDSSLP